MRQPWTLYEDRSDHINSRSFEQPVSALRSRFAYNHVSKISHTSQLEEANTHKSANTNAGIFVTRNLGR